MCKFFIRHNNIVNADYNYALVLVLNKNKIIVELRNYVRAHPCIHPLLGQIFLGDFAKNRWVYHCVQWVRNHWFISSQAKHINPTDMGRYDKDVFKYIKPWVAEWIVRMISDRRNGTSNKFRYDVFITGD